MARKVAGVAHGFRQVASGFQEVINVIIVPEHRSHADGVDLHPQQFLRGGRQSRYFRQAVFSGHSESSIGRDA